LNSSVFDLAVRLSLQAGGLASGAAMAMSSFGSIKQAAAAADASVLSHQRTLDRMNFMGASQQSKTYQYALQQQGQAATAAAVAHDKLARAQQGANLIGAGVASLGVGMAGADVLKHWIDSAGLLEIAMSKVRLATGATDSQLQAMQRGDLGIAERNQMSITEVERLRGTAAQSGLNSLPQLNALLPELARLSEVLKITKGFSPEESATTGVQFAHIFQGYTAAAMKPLLDQFARALQTSSATPSEFIHTLSGFAGVAKTMYGSGPGQAQKASSDAIAMTALLDNLGQGGRGGTQLRALLLNSMDMISARGAIHNKALGYLEKEAGGSFFNKQGQFAGMQNMMELLQRASLAISNPKNSATIDRAALTAGGATLAGMLGDPAVVARFRSIQQNVSGKGSLFSLDSSQSFVNATQVGRFNQLQANMETISALMGQKLLPAVVAVATALTQATAGIIDFVDQHPLIAQFAATFVAIGSAIALVAAPVLVAACAFAILSTSGVVLGLSFAPFLLLALGIVAAVTGIIVLFTHWGQVTDWLGTRMHTLLLQLEGLPAALKNVPVVGGAAQAAIPGVQGWTQPRPGGNLFDWMGSGDWRKIIFGDIHLPGMGGGYGIGTLPQHYPVLVGGLPARSQGAATLAPGAARPSGAHGPVTNHYNVTINTTSDQHARAVAREAVRELQRHESARMRDLHRYGSLTPSGVELGFHGS